MQVMAMTDVMSLYPACVSSVATGAVCGPDDVDWITRYIIYVCIYVCVDHEVYNM
jgi:hypothetical protein